MNPTIKRIYGEIAMDLNISPRCVSDIVTKQFEFVKEVMAEGDQNNPESFKNIQLTHLGKFATRKYKLEEYARKARNRKQD